MKKIIISTSLVLLLILMSLGIILIFNSIKNDKKNIKIKKEEIDEYYDTFNSSANKFNDIKKEYDEIINNIYYSTVEEERENLLTTINKYDEIMSNLNKERTELEERCSIYYTNSETRQKCNSYKVSYNNAKELYKKDIELFNKLVEEYNKWTTTKNLPQKLEKHNLVNLE